jgi:lysophospholipase L1-like esterase
VALLFSPPSVNDGAAYRADADIVTRKLWGHMARHNTGVTVLKTNGVYVDQQYVYHDDLVAADIAYQGGHIYQVDYDEALALLEAGYELSGAGSWFQALVDCDDSRGDILWIGDSISEGTGVTTTTARVTNLAQDLFRAAYPTTGVTTGGVGYQSARNASNSIVDDPVRAGSHLLSGANGWGYDAVFISGGTVTFPARDCTRIRVHYSAISQAGTLSVVVDGGTPVIIPCSSTELVYKDRYFDIPLGASLSRDVVVSRGTVGTGFFPNPCLNGIEYFDGDKPDSTYLSLPATAVTSRAATPASAALDLSGAEHTFRVKFRADQAANGGNQYLLIRSDVLANDISYLLYLEADGHPALSVSTNGTTYLTAIAGGDPLDDDTDYWLEGKIVRNDGSNRTVDFRISTDADDLAQDDGDAVTEWEELGDQFTGIPIGTLHTSAISLRVGGELSGTDLLGRFKGRMYAAQIKDDSTVVVSPVWTGTSNKVIADGQGNIWSAAAAATLESRSDGKGIGIRTAAQSGYTSANFAAGVTGGAALVSDIADWAVGCNLAVIWLGANDYLINVLPLVYSENMQTIIDTVRSGVSDIPIVLVAGWAPQESKLYGWSSYVSALHQLAEVNDNVSVVDFTSSDAPVVDLLDTVHPSPAGHVTAAAYMFAQLDPATSTVLF